jgi:hypothetical protein
MSCAYDINDRGQITGQVFDYENSWAFRYSDERGFEILPLPFGSSFLPTGRSIDKTGSVVGYDINGKGVFRYMDGIGSTALPYPPKASSVQAWATNNLGQIVATCNIPGEGERAFLYSEAGGWQNLNDLIDPVSGWVLRYAFDISDRGQIAGSGLHNGVRRAFRMTPVPNRKLPPTSSPPPKKR